MRISSLRDVARTDPGLVAAYLEPLSDADQARWGLLNTALFVDGLYIKVTGKAAAPLVIVHALSADGANAIAYPRVIIDAAPGCGATLIEHYVQHGERPPLCNSATHIAARRDSRIEHYRVFATGAAAEHIDSSTSARSATAASSNSPSPRAAAWCAPRSRRA